MKGRSPTFAAALLLAAITAAAAHAQARTYVLDPTHSFPRVTYSHFGYSTQLIRFNRTTGTVVYDRQARTGAVDIVIDTTSVDTGLARFDEHIQGPDFLDTATYPTATFKSTRVLFAGDQPTAVEGDLTIKGVTKPVTLRITSFRNMPHPMAKKDAIGANAAVTIRRSEFNAGKHAPDVSDEVDIEIGVEAIAQ